MAVYTISPDDNLFQSLISTISSSEYGDTNKDGDTIILSSGAYDADFFKIINRDFSASGGLTIIAEAGSEVTIEGTLTITGSKDITFSGITFQAVEKHFSPIGDDDLSYKVGSIRGQKAVSVSKSDSISFTDSEFLGYEVTQDYAIASSFKNEENVYVDAIFNADNDPESNEIGQRGIGGIGLAISDSQNVVVTSSKFEGLEHGITFLPRYVSDGEDPFDQLTKGTIISGNEFTGIQTDAIRGTDHYGTIISHNFIGNFAPLHYDPENPNVEPKTHSDGFQYWSTNASYGVTDLTIDSNVFYSPNTLMQAILGGDAGAPQEIRNEQGELVATQVSFKNFSITNNIVFSGSPNGISLRGLVGDEENVSLLANNTVVGSGEGEIPRIILGGDWLKRTELGYIFKDEKNKKVFLEKEVTAENEGRNTSYIDVYDNLVHTATSVENPIRIAYFPNADLGIFETLNIELSSDEAIENSNLSFQDATELFSGLNDDVFEINDLIISPESGFEGVGSTLMYSRDIREALWGYDPLDYNFIEGGDGDDRLTGTDEADWIEGGEGRDIIKGGAGDDYIIAGPGDHAFINGGAGADVFEFGVGDGDQKIADWEDGVDKVRLVDGLTLDNIIDVEDRDNGVAILSFETEQGTQRLMFHDLDSSALTVDDFLIA